MARISAPIPAPTQKPPKPFPAWRLKNGVKNASEPELESASESAERWGWGCGGLVVLGIIGEFVIAILNPPFGCFLERWGPPVCDLMIGFGVAGEIMFARMGHRFDGILRSRSNERTAAAELALERLRAANAWRGLTAAQMATLKAELSKADLPAAVAFRLMSTHPEVHSFANDLSRTFEAAGWVPTWSNDSNPGAWYGVYVPNPAQPDDVAIALVRCIRDAFMKAEIPFGIQHPSGRPTPAVLRGSTQNLRSSHM
jgi:hypothetical protein